MNDHFSPVANPAPPRPRWPDALTSLTSQSRPFSTIALVPSQAPPARREFIQNLRERGRVKILVIVIVDLCHWRVHAGAEALDFHPGELAVGGHLHRFAKTLLAHVLERVGTTQHARRRRAELHVKF